MVSLLTHAVLGLAVITWIIASNRAVFSRPAGGSLFSPLELLYYVVGIGEEETRLNIATIESSAGEVGAGGVCALGGLRGGAADFAYRRALSQDSTASLLLQDLVDQMHCAGGVDFVL